MGKAEENKIKKQTALLSQAFTLFMKQGIAKTSIADIAEKAGVAKGTFYSYFKDKEDLIEKLISQKAEQLLNNSVKKIKRSPEYKAGTMSVEDKLVFICDDLLNQLSKNKKLLIFINKNLNLGLLYKAFTKKEFKLETNVLELFHNMLDEDESEWHDADLMLYTIIELVSSTCHSIILRSYPVDLETYKPHLHKCIRSIVGAYRG